MTSIPNGRER